MSAAFSDSMGFMEEPSQFSVGQNAQSLTCSIMEKPHTGLDECLGILLLCFRARTSDGKDTGTAELGVTHATAPPHATGPAAYFLDGSGMGMYLLPPERQKPGIPDERWTNEACARARNRSRIDAVISH